VNITDEHWASTYTSCPQRRILWSDSHKPSMNWKFWKRQPEDQRKREADKVDERGKSQKPKAEAKGQADPSRRDVYYAFGIALFIGLTALWLFAYAQGHFLQYTGTGMMIAGAAFFIGVILGFLFGIPYTVHQALLSGAAPTPQTPVANAPRGGATPGSPLESQQPSPPTGSDYRVNTNLEQISDWLTKILVGIGLTQLVNAPPQFWKLSGLLAGALGGPAALTTALVLAILLYFSIWDFCLDISGQEFI